MLLIGLFRTSELKSWKTENGDHGYRLQRLVYTINYRWFSGSKRRSVQARRTVVNCEVGRLKMVQKMFKFLILKISQMNLVALALALKISV